MSDSASCRRRRWHPAPPVLLVAACLAATPPTALAQRALSHYMRVEWSAERGFPGGHVHAITQSADGHLWIGAEKGLVRFDGVTFRLFAPPRDVADVVGTAILGVAPTDDGALLVRPQGVALLRFADGRFRNVLSQLGSPESVVTALVPTRDGGVLTATVGRGVHLYARGRFTPVAGTGSLPGSSFVISVAESAGAGGVWLGTASAGLARVRGGQVTSFAAGVPAHKVNTLLTSSDDELWIGTDDGVVRWRPGGSEVHRPKALATVQALAMIRDRAGSLWIAAGRGGLLRVDAGGEVARASAGTSAARYVSALFEDREGNVWVGTDRGIERWRDPVFTTYATDAERGSSAPVGALHVDASGQVWFASAAGGLFTLGEAGRVRPVTAARLDRELVYSIAGTEDTVWVGTRHAGAIGLTPHAGDVSISRLTAADGLPDDSVFALAVARDGALWLASLDAGVSRVADRRVVRFTVKDGLASDTVTAITGGADGTVWCATPAGLSAWQHGRWRTYTTAHGLPSNDITTVFEDRSGVVWVGTARGLAIIDGGGVRMPPRPPGNLTGPIHGVVEDGAQHLWIQGADRLLRVRRASLLREHESGDDLREFGSPDGLPSVDSLRRHRTIVRDGGGRIWVALQGGIARADPARAVASAPVRPVVESVHVDGAQLPGGLVAHVPAGSRRLVFTYGRLSLSSPERVRYRYRLDGFDRDWSTPTADRQATYTNLGPGPYRFRVTASDGEGRWSAAEGQLPLDVAPLLWQTPTFQVAAAAIVLALAWLLYRIRLRRLARQLNLRFEERLAERTRIAQELHDTLLQGFLSASLQLQVLVDRLPEQTADRPAFGRTIDLMRRVIDEGRTAVRGLRSGADRADLAEAFSDLQHELDRRGVRYRVLVAGKPRPLHPAIRDDLYRIGREALSNAFHHASATVVEVEIEYLPGELRVFVRDDGVGIDVQVLEQGRRDHWGLVGMKERASRIGGTLSIRSRAAAGTEIQVVVPARIAFGRDAATGRHAWIRRLVGDRVARVGALAGGRGESRS